MEEAYPASGAAQILKGALPYQGFFFDKPPVSLLFAIVWGSLPGWAARVVGAAFVLACCWAIAWVAKSWFGEAEGTWAAILLGAGLVFYLPAAVMPLAPDLLMVLPHLAAIHFARLGRAAPAGLLAGLAIWINSKGIVVALACGLWSPAAAALGLGLGALQLLWPGNWQQVWVWGWMYSRDTFVERPVLEGAVRTLNWTGFHATAVAGTALYLWREQDKDRWKAAGWLLLSLAAVAGGLRFFPRYYFQLLPVVALLGARGLTRMPVRARLAAAALLLIPAARFGPRYVDLALHGDAGWSDTALNRDSRDVSARIRMAARQGDTILVWGYRPDILVYSKLALGAPYLDSQPLTGVLADRHLVSSRPTVPALAQANRRALSRRRPTWVVDGLGLLNTNLAVARYADLSDWLGNYREEFRTSNTIVYRLR